MTTKLLIATAAVTLACVGLGGHALATGSHHEHKRKHHKCEQQEVTLASHDKYCKSEDDEPKEPEQPVQPTPTPVPEPAPAPEPAPITPAAVTVPNYTNLPTFQGK